MALQKATKQTYFVQLRLDEEGFKIAIEGSVNATEVVFLYWEITDFKKWQIDPELEFHTQTIWFYKSVQENDTRLINDDTLKLVVEAIAETQLKKSLKHVYFDEQGYEVEEKQELFDKNGFSLTVHLDEDFPDPLK